MFIQFHLAALGHLAIWLLIFSEVQRGASGGILFYQGIPVSFVILIAFYFLFRFRLAYSSFDNALVFMIVLNVAHALFIGLHGLILTPLFLITPLRLAIPIVLYSIALHHYNAHRRLTEPQSLDCDSSHI